MKIWNFFSFLFCSYMHIDACSWLAEDFGRRITVTVTEISLNIRFGVPWWSMVFGNMLYFEHRVMVSACIHMYVSLSTSVFLFVPHDSFSPLSLHVSLGICCFSAAIIVFLNQTYCFLLLTQPNLNY